MRHSIRILFTAALLLLSMGASPFALAPIDGKWVATMQGPDGPGQVNLELKAEGETIAGTMDLFGMGKAPISNGKITGSDVAFDLVIGEANFTLPFRGRLEGEKLSLTLETPMGAQTVAFTRPPAP